jgi:hypothetical protein
MSFVFYAVPFKTNGRSPHHLVFYNYKIFYGESLSIAFDIA